jgi:hypothetical protein
MQIRIALIPSTFVYLSPNDIATHNTVYYIVESEILRNTQ